MAPNPLISMAECLNPDTREQVYIPLMQCGRLNDARLFRVSLHVRAGAASSVRKWKYVSNLFSMIVCLLSSDTFDHNIIPNGVPRRSGRFVVFIKRQKIDLSFHYVFISILCVF